jgi:superfamily I DNA/RNA helicase
MQSSADLFEVESRDHQFNAMVAKLTTQLKAYNKEILGVLVAKLSALNDLRARFAHTDLQDHVVFHDEADASFAGDRRIHVMTIAAAKGTEFRTVHLYATEDVSAQQDHQGFWYTAVTRAKTSLTAYASPGARPLSNILKAGFAQTEQLPSLDSLFGGT